MTLTSTDDFGFVNTDEKVIKISSKYQENDTNEFPGDVVNTTDEKNIMYSIPQADNCHNNNGHTGRVERKI